MIKNFVFDMGEILIHFDIRAFADRYDITEEEKELVLSEVFYGNANWSLSDWGYVSESEVARRACERLPEHLHEAAYGVATKWFEPLIPVKGMEDVVRRIKEAGYGVYLLSNAGLLHGEYWDKVPGSRYFDGKLVSAFEKLVKPQPEIYRLLLERFGLKAEECVFVDDREINLAGAEICGMSSIAFRNAEDFVRQLSERGINI